MGNVPKYQFSVEIPELGVVGFQEVSGLDLEPSLVQYRRLKPGVSPSTIKTPGIQKTANITLKRGVFARNDKFRDWYNGVTSNQAKRSTVTIKLIDDRGNSAMTWTLTNALPTKITGADLDATGNDVAIESLEIAHDRLTVSNS